MCECVYLCMYVYTYFLKSPQEIILWPCTVFLMSCVHPSQHVLRIFYYRGLLLPLIAPCIMSFCTVSARLHLSDISLAQIHWPPLWQLQKHCSVVVGMLNTNWSGATQTLQGPINTTGGLLWIGQDMRREIWDIRYEIWQWQTDWKGLRFDLRRK